MKQLYRVTVEGEILVMAENAYEARIEAKRALDDEAEYLIEDVEPLVKVHERSPMALKYIDAGVLESFPWNADAGDDRTVADHIKALGVEL
jgi:hypothetical protein